MTYALRKAYARHGDKRSSCASAEVSEARYRPTKASFGVGTPNAAQLRVGIQNP
jgi:hypothetical protein